VKRIEGPLPDKDEVSLISLRDLDSVIGAGVCSDDGELVFVSREANLLAFPASSVRPQGLPASGMAGINLGDSKAVYFGIGKSESILVTAANGSLSLGDTDPGSVKLTRLSAYPRKGRGAMGVRCHRFLKGEDQLYFAGLSDLSLVFDLDGSPMASASVDDRRDGSGVALASYLGTVA
jgi:DNA gyrase subunit A